MGTVASVILGVIGLLAFLTWVGQVVATTADMFRSRDKPRLGSWRLWFLSAFIWAGACSSGAYLVNAETDRKERQEMREFRREVERDERRSEREQEQIRRELERESDY